MNYQRNWRIARNRNAKMLLLLTCLLISQVNSITTLEDSIFYNHLTSNNIDENISLEGVKYKNVPKLRSYLSEKAYRSFINSDEHDEQDTISDLTVPETLPNNNRAGMFKITGGESVTNNILPINGDFEADSPGIYFQNQGGFMTGWDHLNNFRNIGPVEGRIVSGQSFVIVDQDGANYGSPAGEIQTHDMYNFTIEETETYMISSHLRVNCASGSTDRDLYAEVNFNFYNSTSDMLGGVSFRIHRNWPGINGSNSFSFDLAKS